MPDIDESRRELDLATAEQLLQRLDQGVRLLDTTTVLISPHVRMAAGAIVYPGVVVRADQDSRITIGGGTVLYPGTLVIAERGGEIVIGDDCELGPGGVQVKANVPGVRIVVDDGARLLNGCEVVGTSTIGRGCQVIGTIAAQSIQLAGGEGGHSTSDPDLRGAVLKGSGLARAITLQMGEVRNLTTSFEDVPTERQSHYHPK